MRIAMVGAGKMGGQMIERLVRAGHEVVARDLSEENLDRAVALGALRGGGDRTETAAILGERPVVWLMIPAGLVDEELDAWLAILPEGSVVIDGGNSNFNLTQQRAVRAAAKHIEFMDVGTSGGVHGLKNGFSMMVGGSPAAVEYVKPLIEALAQEDGWHHFGPAGSGHFIKMVHNAVEYGMMEAYAEGYRLIKEGPFPGVDLAQVARVWQHGSVVQSWLNELIHGFMLEDQELEGVEGVVAESGETRWALEHAETANIPLPVIRASFDVRLNSLKGEVNYATKVLARLRNAFGGHEVNVK